MGIALLALGALISLGGWGVLLTGFGLEAPSAAAGGLPYLPSAPSIDGMRVVIVEQVILLGYLLMTLGAVTWAASKISNLVQDLEREEREERELAPRPLARVEPEAVTASRNPTNDSFLSKARQEDHKAEEVEEGAAFAQVVQEGEIEGCHFIEYDNGIVDVQTAAGWRRFDSLEQAVAQLRRGA